MEIGDWITLGAVLVALGIGVASIWHIQSLQKKDRKERLLNEIIDWAKNISKCGIKEDIDFWIHDDVPKDDTPDEVSSSYLETYLQKPKHDPKYECLYWLQLLSKFLVIKEE